MWALLATALAYETDQLTYRDAPLADATDAAEDLLGPLLERAVERTNRRTGCEGSDDRVRRVLARSIERATGGQVWVLSRGLFRAPGFTRYSAALTRSDAPRLGFADREDIYGEMTLAQSLILWLGGPCPTFAIGGHRIGTDKLDHFFGLGHRYFRVVSRGGTEHEAAMHGTATELRFFGLLTSKTFSFADLKANWDGYRFYAGLLGPDSLFQRDRDGCVEQVAPWRWSAWVDADWDEVLNPGVYTRLVQRRLTRTLEQRRPQVCPGYATWGADADRARRMAGLNEPEPWAAGKVPLRTDPFQLDALCDPERHEPLSPPPLRGFVHR